MSKAWLIEKHNDTTSASLKDIAKENHPQRPVEIRVEYSSINYKDALAINSANKSGRGGVIRSFPIVPGIDVAGVVVRSEVAGFQPGERVFVTGNGIGEEHWGGYSETFFAESQWLMKVPQSMTTKQVMSLGTAGLTAMQCVMALEESSIAKEPVLVTGASGGVGSISCYVLAKLGYEVHASTSKESVAKLLRGFGVSEILSREDVSATHKPLEREKWAGGVDTVGGHALSRMLASTRYLGAVAACGVAASGELPTSVFPFIIRGVSLHGISSVYCPIERRQRAWERLASTIGNDFYESMIEEVGLDGIPEACQKILDGKIQGRFVVGVS